MQYLVIDLKRFTPYSELQPGLLTVVETMPGQVVSADRWEGWDERRGAVWTEMRAIKC